MKKIVTLASLMLFVSLALSAQEIEYNKKKNKFMVGETPIAQLESRKDNGWGFSRSFFIQDLQAKNIISFLCISNKDTLFDEFHEWYDVEMHDLNLKFQLASGTEVNAEKYFARIVAENNLLKADGKLNEEKCRAFMDKNTYDYRSAYQQYNDSLKRLIDVPKMVVARKNNKPYVADKFGKIGQGDAVIANWETVAIPSKFFNEKPTRYYFFKNLNGGIVASVNTKGELTTFEKKRNTTNATPNSNKELIYITGEDELNYLARVAQYLGNKGIL